MPIEADDPDALGGITIVSRQATTTPDAWRTTGLFGSSK